MFKIAYCAGHYLSTPGKRIPKELDPNETCEWVLNDRVADAFAEAAAQYDGVQLYRTDDCTGKTFTDIPVVFTADMNVVEGSENYQQFVESGVLKDTKKLAPDTMDYCTYHDTKPEKHTDDVIDYVMINDNFEAVSYKVVTEGIDGRFVSDHYPVYADIIMK